MKYEIVGVNDEAGTLQVKFLNPNYTGLYIKEEDGVTYDNDPFPHVTKTINVPYLISGLVDETALNEIIEAQSRGVSYRMDIEKGSMNYSTEDLNKKYKIKPNANTI